MTKRSELLLTEGIQTGPSLCVKDAVEEILVSAAILHCLFMHFIALRFIEK